MCVKYCREKTVYQDFTIVSGFCNPLQKSLAKLSGTKQQQLRRLEWLRKPFVSAKGPGQEVWKCVQRLVTRVHGATSP